MNTEFLRRHILSTFDMPAEDLNRMIRLVQPKEYAKGQLVVKEGEVCRTFYLVEKGYLRTWYNKEGIPINLNFTLEGQFVSNIKSLKTRQPSEINIEASEDSTLWLFNLDNMPEAWKRHPAMSGFARRVAMHMLLEAQSHSDMCKINTPAERYHYIETHNPALLQRVPLSQLASYLGVTRETLSRIRANSY